MKDSRCVICKYLGDHRAKELHRGEIFRDKASSIGLSLCYFHSWELYREGQKKFIARYRPNFMEFFGTESEKELIEFIKGERGSGNSTLAF